MNSKIEALFVALMIAAMLASPAFAASPNKGEVRCDDLHTTGYDPATLDKWTTDGGITHIEYMKMWGTIDVWVNDVKVYDDVSWVDIVSGTYNTKTKEGVMQFDEVWTLPGGTLEGVAHITLVGGSLTTYKEMYSHIILHGTDAFEGQILSMELGYVRGVTTPAYEGYWLFFED